MMLAHIGKKLNLDANQAAKLKVLGDLLVAQHTPPAAGTPNPHAALIAGNTFDRAGATQLMNQHVAKMQANGPALINAFGDFFDSLNADAAGTGARDGRPAPRHDDVRHGRHGSRRHARPPRPARRVGPAGN
jgi:hypothetical protein